MCIRDRWGGREGYETLLNTNFSKELDNMGRFLSMVVEYKHKIGFKGTILVEPKPQEPSKHQYDFDVATCIGFLRKYGLENEVKLNIEQGHAILAGHSFEHEIALAVSEGMLGSIDMNRNDYQSGWDTDQFPNNVPEVALAYYHILGGVLNALDGVGPEQLNIEKLGQRIKQNDVQEIILALSATIDGQTTLHFLIDYLEDFNIKITKLAHGIPIGGELDYLDDGTLTQAILSRTEAD